MPFTKFYGIKLEDSTDIAMVEHIINKVVNLRSLSYWDAVKEIFLEGVTFLTTQNDTRITDESLQLGFKLADKLERVTNDRLREQQTIRLLELIGPEEFAKWCKEEGNIDPEPIIGNSEAIKQRIAADESMSLAVWLDNYLSDLLPHKYDKIIEDAIFDGKIPNAVLYPDAYQTKVRSLQNMASARGYSSRERRGIWQKQLV